MPLETVYGVISGVISALLAKILSPSSVHIRDTLLLILGMSSGKEFQAETFAMSVLTRNKEVFEKLADK